MKKTIFIFFIIIIVLCACMFTACKKHVHSFEYTPNIETHLKKYTCGCNEFTTSEFHQDNDYDGMCDKCKTTVREKSNQTSKTINTEDNYIIFPTEKSDLHREVLNEALLEYSINNNKGFEKYGDFEICSLISEQDSQKYNLDIFQAKIGQDDVYYFAKYKDDIYFISPFPLSYKGNNCITSIAITDINDDGYVEILTSVLTGIRDGSSGMSFITVIDTSTRHSIKMTIYDNIVCFKENYDGVVSLYNANGALPSSDDIQNGKLNDKYYDSADNLFDTPILNTSNYEFADRTVNASCDLFSVEITVCDAAIDFPYLFMDDYFGVYFEVNVKMTYLGRSFCYVSSDGYLDSAVAVFTNNANQIECEGWLLSEVITEFTIKRGEVLERTYRYVDSARNLNVEGIYDMIITYELEEEGIFETIVIEDFLRLTR